MNPSDLTISQIGQGLRKKEFSAQDLSAAYLKEIKERDGNISSFLSLNEEQALAQAKEVDEMIAKGQEIGPLAGVPCAVKDNIMVKGLKCTAGSKMLEDYLAPYDATVVKKFRKEKAIILGKTNLDEFAMGSSTENSAFGPTRNPSDPARVPGGSSGGSAAAVAAGFSCCSLGSDTGGSIRLPASFCGVVGLKPTYGSVSRYGLIAFASSLDQIGPFSKNIEDCKIVFDAIKGQDQMDSTSVPLKEEKKKMEIKSLKIGVPKEYFVKGIDPEVEKIIKGAIKKYEEAGARIEEVSLRNTEYALPAYYIISPSEASANLARFDGIKYGYSFGKGKNLMDVYLETRGKGFGPEVRRRIMIGTYALSSGYYEAYYLRAQKVRNLIKKDFEKAFEKVDVLMAPVSPFLPFKIGEKVQDPLSMYLVDIYTVSVNLAGLPALSVPAGRVEGLPVGLQIIGKPFQEDMIMETGRFLEDNK